jgi:CMP-N,N'-diacetyllegionaminic acid synthase
MEDCKSQAALEQKPEVLAIIPARGGSKGIPRKNIVDLCGKPLIAYSIEVALKSNMITRVVVSTEDEEIAEVSKAYGAEVPFLRPAELATDTCSLGDAISYTVSRLGGPMQYRAFVELYTTSPFRTPEFIDEMLHILFKGYTSVTTVKEISVDSRFIFVRGKEEEELTNVFGEQGHLEPWKKLYRQYPSLQAYLPQKIEKHYYHVLTDKCMLIDIDTPRDLRWAEAVIRNRLFDFRC